MHRSGTNEEITEKGQLLQELSDIYADKDSTSLLDIGSKGKTGRTASKEEANQHRQSTGVPANQAC